MGKQEHSASSKLTSGKLLFIGWGCFFVSGIAFTIGQAVHALQGPRWVVGLLDFSAMAVAVSGTISIPFSAALPSAKRRKRVTFEQVSKQKSTEGSKAEA